MLTLCPLMLTSGPLVNADAHALLDGHPANGGLRCQLRLGRELLRQDAQHGVHFPVHLMNLDL